MDGETIAVSRALPEENISWASGTRGKEHVPHLGHFRRLHWGQLEDSCLPTGWSCPEASG